MNSNIDIQKFNEQQTRDWLKNLLHEGNVVVTFNKLNGDERVMTCTLKEDIVPETKTKDSDTEKKERKPNEDVCVVWDVNANGWRSFRWDKITGVEYNVAN